MTRTPTLNLNLHRGDRLEIDGRQLVFEQHLGHGILQLTCARTGGPFQVENSETGELRPATAAWLDEQRFEGKVRILRDRRGAHISRLAPPCDFDVDLNQLDKGGRERVHRMRWLTELDNSESAIPLSDRGLHRFITAARSKSLLTEMGEPPSATTLRRWSNRRGLPGDRRLHDMVSRRGRAPRRSSFGPHIDELIRRGVASYWSDISRDMLECYGELRRLAFYINNRRAGWRIHADGRTRIRRVERASEFPPLPIPSFETFRRAVTAAECRDTYAARYGQKAADTRFKANGRGIDAKRILECAILDHTGWDAFAVVDGQTGEPLGRPTLSLIIDAYSRCVLGWVLTYEPPCLYSALEAMKRANRPKLEFLHRFPQYPDLVYLYGRMLELVVDNALEVAGGSVRDGLLDLGISIRYAPVAQPQYKAIGERIFLTIKRLLAHRLPGAVKFSPDRMRELGLDPKATALLTRAEMELLLGEAIAVYHYDVHRTIGTRPIQRWLADVARHGIDVIDDERKLDQMLGAVKQCSLSRSGVEFESLRFSDPPVVSQLLDQLAPLEPKRDRRRGSATARVKIKYNPANLESIEVYNKATKQYVRLPCVDQDYAGGLSLWSHRQLKRYAAQQNLAFASGVDRYEARVRLRAAIEALSPDLKFRHRRAVARLLEPPASHAIDGDVVRIARAPARHDGLAPTLVQHRTLAEDRSDEGEPAPTRKRGGNSQSRTRRAPKAPPVPTTGEGRAFHRLPAIIEDPDAFLDNLGWGHASSGSDGA